MREPVSKDGDTHMCIHIHNTTIKKYKGRINTCIIDAKRVISSKGYVRAMFQRYNGITDTDFIKF